MTEFKYWSLEVVYPNDRQRQNSYPMGDAEQFEDITYFINWNVSELTDLVEYYDTDHADEWRQVIEALKTGKFKTREAADEIIVRVEVR